tara:strand:+ start:702 stop:971 length:270 start_codon:yes stop_codon:yes gene_type:complete
VERPQSEKKLQEQLDALSAKSQKDRSVEINTALAATAKRLRAEKMPDRALTIGEEAPNFTLPNALGIHVSLENLLEKGPAIVAWYRGGW